MDFGIYNLNEEREDMDAPLGEVPEEDELGDEDEDEYDYEDDDDE